MVTFAALWGNSTPRSRSAVVNEQESASDPNSVEITGLTVAEIQSVERRQPKRCPTPETREESKRGRKMAMKLLPMIWGATCLTTTLAAGAAHGGGPTYCEHPIDPFAAGSYEIVIEPSGNSAEVAKWMRQDVARIMSESPQLFEGVTIDVVEKGPTNDASLAQTSTASTEQSLSSDEDSTRAYIVLDQLQSVAAPFGNEDTVDPVVSVPEFDASKARAELGGTALSESEYYREVARHAALTSMLYWNGEHNDRIAELTYEHILSNLKNEDGQ